MFGFLVLNIEPDLHKYYVLLLQFRMVGALFKMCNNVYKCIY